MRQLNQTNEFISELKAEWVCENNNKLGGSWKVEEESLYRHMGLLKSLGAGEPVNTILQGNLVFFLLYLSELKEFVSLHIKSNDPAGFIKRYKNHNSEFKYD